MTSVQRAPWRALAEGALDFLLPGVCVLCRRRHRPVNRDGIVCGYCWAQVVAFPHPQCERCGHPRVSLAMSVPGSAGEARPELPPCRWCPRLSPALRAVRSVARMDIGTGGGLVHALKYQGWSRVAPSMARRMARLDWPPDVLEERSMIIPIPLGRGRLRERGYNQAELLANGLSPWWRASVLSDALVRVRDTRSQVRLTPSDRSGNVSRAFVVPKERRAALRGRHVVLVDDVITTAATVNAAVDALLDGGARIISCATFGRAPDPGDRTAHISDFTRN